MPGESTAWRDDREGTTGFTRLPYPTEMSSPASRATSPGLFSIRFGSVSQPDGQQASQRAKGGNNPDSLPSLKNGRASKSSDKGKEPLRGDSVSLDESVTSKSTDGGPSNSHYHTSSPFMLHGRPRPAESSIHGARRTRGSLLIAASDAFSFKFGRRRPSIRQTPVPIILPDVIEISAPRPDEEVEERSRLREMAAQAIGLGPFMVQPETHSHEGSTEEDEGSSELPNPRFTPELRRLGDVRGSESAPNISGRSPHGSSLSVVAPSALPPGRYRSGSMLVHARTNSTTMAPIPPFPTKASSLTTFRQSTAMLPKYYPPSSLRIFALSKSWKSRFLVLSSPTTLLTRGQTPAVSYLHLFKSSNTEERELERLEINEDSVVFVAEDEVGGRRNVIKIGGVDVGALKKEWNYEEGGRTMWLLQITDPVEAQKWISTIKNAILGQRTVRAGLLPGTTYGGIEPRGDMDVMLSIRAQGLVTSSSASPRPGPETPPQTISQGDHHYASSISSHSVRSQSTVPKMAPSGTVSTLKGLFTASRPRSASRAASIESERQQVDREVNDDSFTRMGSSLLNMMRSNTPDSQSATPPANGGANRHTLPFAPSPPIGRPIDRKILSERQPLQWVTKDPPFAPKERANRTLSLGAMSLQPPPRKRWTSVGPTIITTTPEESTAKTQVNGIGGFANTFGHKSSYGRSSQERASCERAETEPSGSPTDLSGFSFGTPEQRPRAPSLQSVSTYASGENAVAERSSSSTKRSSNGKRWSRQGLPHRLTPPSGPPPAIPPTHSATRLHVHPYAAEIPPSQTSSSHSVNSQRSVVSSLPSFSKRASGSSFRSVNTSSTTQSHSSFHNTSAPRPLSSHRTSMPPPPRPAPTTALPPAPDQDSLKPPESAAASSKSPFRNSAAHRTFRLSMIAPKPPPSGVLPPRPDEPDYKNHRRTSSGSYTRSQLDSIPASPIPPLTASPFPPPVGPLPPTPANAPSDALPAPTSRHTSFKQRLRILSAPSPSANVTSTQISRPTTASSISPMFTTSPPTTPIAEKITLFQNDPSFLQMHTPVLPSMPPPRLFTPPSEQYAELISLSPPPRRGSKQVLETGSESPELLCTPNEKLEGEPRLLSLSRPGSVISLGVVSV